MAYSIAFPLDYTQMVPQPYLPYFVDQTNNGVGNPQVVSSHALPLRAHP